MSFSDEGPNTSRWLLTVHELSSSSSSSSSTSSFSIQVACASSRCSHGRSHSSKWFVANLHTHVCALHVSKSIWLAAAVDLCCSGVGTAEQRGVLHLQGAGDLRWISIGARRHAGVRCVHASGP